MTGGFGVPFFAPTEAGWQALREVADDADEMPDYDIAAAEVAELSQQQPLELLILDAHAVRRMRDWCLANGHRLDHAGRVAWLLRMSLVMNAPAGSA